MGHQEVSVLIELDEPLDVQRRVEHVRVEVVQEVEARRGELRRAVEDDRRPLAVVDGEQRTVQDERAGPAGVKRRRHVLRDTQPLVGPRGAREGEHRQQKGRDLDSSTLHGNLPFVCGRIAKHHRAGRADV
jgi:hypothetical protein